MNQPPINFVAIGNAIKAAKARKNRTGRPTSDADIKAYQEEMAEKGLEWNPKTNAVRNKVGGKSGQEMQKDSSIMKLKTFQSPTEKEMANNAVMSTGVDRKSVGLERRPQRDPTPEELFEGGYKINEQTGDPIKMKAGDIIKIGGKSYRWEKEGQKLPKNNK